MIDSLDTLSMGSGMLLEVDSTTLCQMSLEVDSTTLCHPEDEYTEQKSRSRTSTYLPPCRICKKKASGFHYGVNTCEACKGFYRRTMQKLGKGMELSFRCEKDEKCPIEQERNMCSFCRFQRCLDVGMSKQAIKQGRYTHARKAEYTKEIKGLPDIACKMEPRFQSNSDDYEMNNLIGKFIEVQEKHMPGFRERFQNYDLFHDTQKEIYKHQCILLSEEQSPGHLPKCLSSEVVVANTHEEERRALMEIFTSGLDKLIRFLVEFVKCIPGFKDLFLADQSELLKAGFLEFGFIGDVCLFNLDMKVMLGLFNLPIEKLYIHKILDDNIGEEIIKFVRKMQEIHVTAEEISLLRAIQVLFTDRCHLEDTSKIDEIQLQLVQYLQFMTRHSKGRFGILMGQLAALRTLQLERILDSLIKFKNESSYMNSFPVINEVISTKFMQGPEN